MRAIEKMSTDFRVIDADWTSDLARDVVKSSSARFIAVRQQKDTDTAYYVFRRDEFDPFDDDSFDLTTLIHKAKHRAASIVFEDASFVRSSRPQVVISGLGPSGVIVPREGVRAAGGGAGDASFVTLDGRAWDASFLTLEGRPTTRTVAEQNSPELVTRHLSAELPEQAVVNTRVELAITLSADDSELANRAFAAEVPLGSRLDIVVDASGALALDGKDVISFKVEEPQATQTHRFSLKAEREGVGHVKARVHQDGEFLFTITLRTTVTTAVAGARKETALRTITAGSAAPVHPDVSLLIVESGNKLTFRVQDKNDDMQMVNRGTVELHGNQQEYFTSFFADIEGLPHDSEELQYKLRSKGANLFETLFPPGLRQFLWEARERIQSVRIISDQSWIPWELCRITGKDGDRVLEGKFLAEYAVTRWLDRQRGAPRELRMNPMALIVTEDSNLRHAAQERDYILSLRERAWVVDSVPATFAAVSAQMERGDYAAWHFTGHARASQNSDANQAAIELNNRRPLKVEDFSGSSQTMLRAQPLIFFNACQSAQGGMSLTGVGGWAERFIGGDRGTAAAFIGAYWAVDDALAHTFARELYSGLLSGKTIGEAARDARAAIQTTKDDPSWLAYTVYAHPSARLAADP